MTDSIIWNDTDDAPESVAALVRERDRDIYLCLLLAPKSCRDALFALHAFNSEILRARMGVSEAAIGQMRMKWWYDALERIFAGDPPHHPVALAMSRAVPLGLDRAALEAIVEAQADALAASPDYSLAALLGRADAEQGPLFRQMLDLLGARDPETDRRAEAAARAWGLVRTLRRQPVTPGAVREVHAAALEQRHVAGSPSGTSAPVFLLMILADIYLDRIAKAEFDLRHSLVRRADPGGLALPKLWWAARRA